MAAIIAPFAGGYGLAFLGLAIVSLFIPEAKGAMMAISPVQAQSLFTDKLIAVYKEKVSVTSFLRSFFTPIESQTKYVSIAVKRGLEKIAVDVNRFSDGTRNTFSKESLKEFLPPYFDEYFTANEHRLYDTVVAMLAVGNTTYFAQMTAELAEDLMTLQMKIERAIELQCAQIFQSGVITLNSGENIDFKRKAASIVAYNVANDFNVGTVSPYKVLQAGCEFIRTKGKVQGGVFNAILGSEAMTALQDNTIVQKRADIKNFSLDMVRDPQRNSVGGTLHGEISCGSYKVRLWTYPEYYDNASNVAVPYIDPKKVILLPEQTQFNIAYAAVPQLISENGTIPQKGAYLVQDFRNEEKGSHTVHIKSAPIAIPTAIDTIYTVDVVAP